MKTNITNKVAIIGAMFGAAIIGCDAGGLVVVGKYYHGRPDPADAGTDAEPELCAPLDGPSAASDALDNQCGKDAYRVLCAAETLDMPEVILEALGVTGSVSCLEDSETKALTCCANK